MRDIKFRAWHIKANYMCKNVNTNFLYKDYLIFMQYTGLKDVNGKEIYEGDILNVIKEYGENFIPVHVVFSDGGFKVQAIDEMTEPFDLCKIILTNEVIGNIYEDKKLLQKDQYLEV